MYASETSYSSLYDVFERMNQQLDELFGGGGQSTGIRSVLGQNFPGVNISSSDEHIDVYVFSPGVARDDLELSLEHNLLSISGERNSSIPEDSQRYRVERSSGKFRKVLTLPDDIDPDQVEANYRDGVLHLRIKRRESRKPRRSRFNRRMPS